MTQSLQSHLWLRPTSHEGRRHFLLCIPPFTHPLFLTVKCWKNLQTYICYIIKVTCNGICIDIGQFGVKLLKTALSFLGTRAAAGPSDSAGGQEQHGASQRTHMFHSQV